MDQFDPQPAVDYWVNSGPRSRRPEQKGHTRKKKSLVCSPTEDFPPGPLTEAGPSHVVLGDSDSDVSNPELEVLSQLDSDLETNESDFEICDDFEGD